MKQAYNWFVFFDIFKNFLLFKQKLNLFVIQPCIGSAPNHIFCKVFVFIQILYFPYFLPNNTIEHIGFFEEHDLDLAAKMEEESNSGIFRRFYVLDFFILVFQHFLFTQSLDE